MPTLRTSRSHLILPLLVAVLGAWLSRVRPERISAPITIIAAVGCAMDMSPAVTT